jgi:hypothetical protein
VRSFGRGIAPVNDAQLILPLTESVLDVRRWPFHGILEVGLQTEHVGVPVTSRGDVISPETDVGESAQQHLNSSLSLEWSNELFIHPPDPNAAALTRGGQPR